MSRLDKDKKDVAKYLPANTRHVVNSGADIWIFKKNTEFNVVFEIAIYYAIDEGGYCAQVISPEIEAAWRDPHVGHLFRDSVICMGHKGPNMKTMHTLRQAFSKACLWAEGMAIMLKTKESGKPVFFPFSNNNSYEDDL